MYNDFSKKTILTGKINDIYFQDFPNGLLMQGNSDYILSIESQPFICKLQLFLYNGITRTVELPIKKDSRNYIIDWGDGSITEIVDIICNDIFKNIEKTKLFKGAAYFNYQQNSTTNQTIQIYDGKQFIKIQISDSITCNNIINYGLSINYNKNYSDTYQLFNYNNFPSHKYPDIEQSYYIKIQGGFTGFNSLINKCFYLLEPSIFPNYNFINIPSSNYNIEGIYQLLNINNNVSSFINTQLSGTSIQMSEDKKIIYFYDSLSAVSGELSGDFSKTSNITLTYNNEEISWKNQLYYNDIQKIRLTDIISWGTNVNWTDMNYAFYNAKYLKSLPNTQLPNVNEFISCFQNCEKLEISNLSSIMPIATINTTSTFFNSNINGDLSEFIMPPYNSIITDMFNNVTKLPRNYSNFNYIRGEIKTEVE